MLLKKTAFENAYNAKVDAIPALITHINAYHATKAIYTKITIHASISAQMDTPESADGAVHAHHIAPPAKTASHIA